MLVKKKNGKKESHISIKSKKTSTTINHLLTLLPADLSNKKVSLTAPVSGGLK